MTSHTEGKNALLFIDEAQRTSIDTLEPVQAMLNFETDTHKTCQVVLSGQLNLRDKLLDQSYKAVRSRIAAPYLMASLAT